MSRTASTTSQGPRSRAGPRASRSAIPSLVSERWLRRLMPLLLRLTTSRFEPDAGIDARILQRLRNHQAAGCIVRSARPRSYLNWRGAAALTDAPAILVLPERGLFSADEWHILVLRDIVTAELRLERRARWDGRNEVIRRVTASARALVPDRPADEHGVLRLILRCDQKLGLLAGR